MEKNNIFKTGKALLFITSGLLFTDACFGGRHSIFSPDEDEKLTDVMTSISPKSHPGLFHQSGKHKGKPYWEAVAKLFPGRTAKQCRERWILALAPTINKDPWESAEDDLLTRGVETHGEGNWSDIAKGIPGRTDQQCRYRYMQYLKNRDPELPTQPRMNLPPPFVLLVRQTPPPPILSINPPLLSIQPAQQILHFPAKITDLLN
jgi:hypothetical protein